VSDVDQAEPEPWAFKIDMHSSWTRIASSPGFEMTMWDSA
jgi:hypothetical protein